MRLKILFLALIFLSARGYGQVINYPNNGLYGIGYQRMVPLQTLWLPTGCGAPVGKASLQAPGTNPRQAAIFSDTCGHHIYWYHPNDSSWSRIDTGSGGGGAGTVTAVLVSTDSLYYTTSSGNTFVAQIITWPDSTIKYVTPTQLAAGLAPKLSAVSTTNSVTGAGTSGSPLQLVGDALNPGNSFYYGTNGSGAKGYNVLPSGVAGANPTAQIALSTVNGVATTFMRSDAAPSLSQGIVPTWTGLHIFNGNLTMGSQFQFSADNTYSVGSVTAGAAHVWSRVFNSDAGVSLLSATGNNVIIGIGSTPGFTLLSTGQGQLNAYITPTTFTGTPTFVLEGDASGHIIQGSIGDADSAIWKDNGTYTGNHVLTMGGYSQSFSGGETLEDTDYVNTTVIFPATAFVNVIGHSKAYGVAASDTTYRYANLYANGVGLPLFDWGVIGQVLVTDSTTIFSHLRPYIPGSVQIIDFEINDILTAINRGVFDATYTFLVDTLENSLGWPGNRILIVGEDAYNGVINADTLVAWNGDVKAIAAAKGCIYYDVYSMISAQPFGTSGPTNIYTVDNEHGTNNWHNLVARGLLNALHNPVYKNGQNFTANGKIQLDQIQLSPQDSATPHTMLLGVDSGKLKVTALTTLPLFNPVQPQIGTLSLSYNNQAPAMYFGGGLMQDFGSAGASDVIFSKNMIFTNGAFYYVSSNTDYGSALRLVGGNFFVQLAPPGAGGSPASPINPLGVFGSGNVAFNGNGSDDGNAVQIDNPNLSAIEVNNGTGTATYHVNGNGQINFQSSSIGFGIGIGTSTVPTAVLHLGAGHSFASQAPLKFTSGTKLTTPEDGAVEYDGTHYYGDIGTTRYQLDQQGVSNYAHTIFTPVTSGTVNLVNKQYNIVNPAGALLAVTLNVPSSPANNDVVYIKFTQTITTVTYANGTVVDGITAPRAGDLVVLVYDAGTTSWY